MFDIPCVIFAGGKSSRMGEDKSLLPFGSYETMAQFQFERLKKIFPQVYLSCKKKDKFKFRANFIEDVVCNTELYAPTKGFVSIYRELDVKRFFAISVDSPFVDKDIIKKLLDADKDTFDATIAKTEFGMQPLCGIYHCSLKEKFEDMLKEDNHKLGYLLKSSNTNFVYFENSEKFLNLNYPRDYQEALRLLEYIV